MATKEPPSPSVRAVVKRLSHSPGFPAVASWANAGRLAGSARASTAMAADKDCLMAEFMAGPLYRTTAILRRMTFNVAPVPWASISTMYPPLATTLPLPLRPSHVT